MHLNLKPLRLFLQNIAHDHWNFPSQPPPRWPFYHLRKPLTISDISVPVVSNVADFRVAHIKVMKTHLTLGTEKHYHSQKNHVQFSHCP